MALIKTVLEKTPQVGQDVFLAENASLIGDVLIQDRVSIWYHTVLRGDVAPIHIGLETNIQDLVMIHGTHQKFSVNIGNRVTIGHSAILHGCTISDHCLIGMGSIVMDQSEIGEFCLVGAGSLVTEGSIFPPRSLILGRPARRIRELSPEEVQSLGRSADHYLLYKTWYDHKI